MSTSPTDQSQWKAPAGDGEILIWPDAPALIDSIIDNQKLLNGADGVSIANVPLSELRREHRAWMGHGNHEQPLIATGHQIELYHPGVWAKNVLMHELATAVGGQAYHVVVDSDAPKHLHLRWPGEAWPITDDPRLASAAWAASLAAPTPAHLRRISEAFDSASRDSTFRPLVPMFLSGLRRLTLETPELTPALTNAVHEIEWQLGLRHHALLASPIWQSQAYLAFAHHILASAASFARAYNAALAQYRDANGIRNAGRPWPDLRVTADECEVPFWFDSVERNARSRGSVVRQGSHFAMRTADGDIIAFEPTVDGRAAPERLGRFLTGKSLRLSPRALTLTCFLRLFMADLFVHGIGGARYDAVTDRVIERWFGVRPPAFAVTTATLLFPEPAEEAQVDLRAIAQEGRRLRHGSDVARKRELVNRIAALPRGSAHRSRLYYEMHSMLDDLAHRPEYRQWQQRYEQAKSIAQRQDALRDRELFFAVQPEDRLKMLIARYHDAVARATSP